MKDAVGELNMTVITVIAIAAIGGLFYIFVWPIIQLQIAHQTCKSFGPEYKAVRLEDTESNGRNNAYKCCPDGEEASAKCFEPED